MLLSGGSTPGPVYQKIAVEGSSKRIDWKNVYITLADERWVSHYDEASNLNLIRNTLLSTSLIPEKNVISINTALESPKDAAKNYEESLTSLFRQLNRKADFLDIAILGLGTDGHTASIFPGSPALSSQNNYNWVFATDSKHQGFFRVSVTPELIRTSQDILFMLKGLEKAQIAYEILRDCPKSDYPVLRVIEGSRKKIAWILDQPASSTLLGKAAPLA